jgi:hypothetical protein
MTGVGGGGGMVGCGSLGSSVTVWRLGAVKTGFTVWAAGLLGWVFVSFGVMVRVSFVLLVALGLGFGFYGNGNGNLRSQSSYMGCLSDVREQSLCNTSSVPSSILLDGKEPQTWVCGERF